MLNPKELKNKILELKCEALGSNFEGICKYEGYTLFVDGALPNEIIRARVEKCQKNYGFAKLLEIIEKSQNRLEPICKYFGVCGGCASQHIDNYFALQSKVNSIKDFYHKNANMEVEVNFPIHSIENLHCRNKTSLPIREEDGQIKIGFFKKRSHKIVDIDDCPVAVENIKEILCVFRQWMKQYNISAYNEITHKGLIRHIIVRHNKNNEIMIILVATSSNVPNVCSLIYKFKDIVKGFVSLFLNINNREDNIILGSKNILLYGEKVLKQELFGINFEISPASFMQVNNELTENLYAYAMDMANVSNEDICLDAYSGAGTISLILANKVKKIYGIEIIKDAVLNAQKTANNNNILNAEFIAGKVEDELPKLIKKGVKIDFVMLDPPRKGIERSVIDSIANANINKIVYISCNPSTQARDVNIFAKHGYKLINLQPVDMFPFTAHVECIALIQRVKS